MRKFLGPVVLLLFAVGCRKEAPPAPQDPASFLKWSMDRYAAMPNFQASVVVNTDSGKKSLASQSRTFRYESPNKFRVESQNADGIKIIAVSDGAREADYDNLNSINSAIDIQAPKSIALAKSTDMVDPNMCGSLLYTFFGGSANFDRLVRGQVRFLGETRTADGEPVRVVTFSTPGPIGNVSAGIGEQTGYVYIFKYDFSGARRQVDSRAELVKAQVKKEDPNLSDAQFDSQLNKLLATGFTELFNNVRVNKPISREAFDRYMPGPAALAALPALPAGNATSPLPLGEPAPDAIVTRLDGKVVTLSSLRGHPVMIDFWATWCAPCREGLPETAALALQGRNSGLDVLAISDETADTIQKFLNHQHYHLNAYRDEGDDAEKAFKIDGLPTEVFIDAKGNVVAYLVGAHPAEDVRAAVQKTGCVLPTTKSHAPG